MGRGSARDEVYGRRNSPRMQCDYYALGFDRAWSRGAACYCCVLGLYGVCVVLLEQYDSRVGGNTLASCAGATMVERIVIRKRKSGVLEQCFKSHCAKTENQCCAACVVRVVTTPKVVQPTRVSNPMQAYAIPSL